MKKQLLMVALTLVSFAPFAQQKPSTMNTAFWKVKMGHSNTFVDASETFLTKFFPVKDGKPQITGYNITGGKHNGEYLFINNIGKLTDKDLEQLKFYAYSSQSSNGTIWFGHYPSASIHRSVKFRSVMK